MGNQLPLTIRPLLYKLLSQKLPENPSDEPLAKILKRAMFTDLEGAGSFMKPCKSQPTKPHVDYWQYYAEYPF